MGACAHGRAPAFFSSVDGTGERGGGDGSGGGKWRRGTRVRLQGAIRAPGRPPGRLVAWRPPGWLGGIPPSSLGARGGEEDPAAPLGRVGWMGRLRLGA